MPDGRGVDEPETLGLCRQAKCGSRSPTVRRWSITAQDISDVCENLRRLAPEPDAVVLAAVLIAESLHPSVHVLLELTGPQTALIRKQ
jgi:hypothetical protein